MSQAGFWKWLVIGILSSRGAIKTDPGLELILGMFGVLVLGPALVILTGSMFLAFAAITVALVFLILHVQYRETLKTKQ